MKVNSIEAPKTKLETTATASGCELKVMDWGQLHFSIQWVHRGEVPESGRGHFQGNCGFAAWYILNGEGLVRQGAVEKRACKGDWLFPNMGPHFRDFSTQTRIISLRYYIEWPDGQPLFRLSEPLLLPGAKYPELLRRAREMERVIGKNGRRNSGGGFRDEKLGFASYLDVQGSLVQWSKALYQALTSEGIKPGMERFEDERVVRALRALDNWPLHRAFSQSQLVEQVGLSRAQLDRLFAAKLGQTAHQYFNRRRLRHAERQVQIPDQPIKEVAFDVGFRHVSSFSAWFKQNTGVNPHERREGTASFPNRLLRMR
jgi:AraC-like DNA-binding protein